MRTRDKYLILSNEEIAQDVYEMKLKGDTSAIASPGEFVQVTVPGVYLPRPISIAYHNSNELWLVYKIIGEGTKLMSEMKKGEEITLLVGCGNGFDLNVDTKKPLLIGGGCGTPPMYDLALKLKEKGIEPTILIGFRSKEDEFYYDKFKDEFKTYITTEDLSLGDEKLVTDVLKNLTTVDYDYIYSCGPKPMLKAINDIMLTDGEFSLETRMACGIGQCKCCSIETNSGMKTLCHDGPVIKKDEIRWSYE